MDRLERHRVLPSWDCPVAGEMGKSSRKWRKLHLLRYSSIFLSKQINFGDEKQQELSPIFNIIYIYIYIYIYI